MSIQIQDPEAKAMLAMSGRQMHSEAYREPEPILDETDSGLDVDALRIVANGVNKLKTNDNAFIIITHYQRLLDYIIPDIVHVLYKGKIIKTAGKELAHIVETKGYDEMIKEQEENG